MRGARSGLRALPARKVDDGSNPSRAANSYVAMAERSIARDCKSRGVKSHAGSNPARHSINMKDGMKLSYENAYQHRDILDSLVSKDDRVLMCGPDWDASAPASWHYRNSHSDRHYAVLVDGIVVGSIDFSIQSTWTETGFFLGKDFRGRGIMRRAWTEKSQSFDTNFMAGTWECNAASRYLLEKLGFENTCKTWVPNRGNVCHYTLLRK